MLSSDQRGFAGAGAIVLVDRLLIRQGLSCKQRTERAYHTLLLQREGNLTAVVVNHEHHWDVVTVDPNLVSRRSGDVIFLGRSAGAVDRHIGLAAAAYGDLLDLAVIDPHHLVRI